VGADPGRRHSGGVFRTDLSHPAPWWVALGGFAAVLAATALHELAHGLALARAGGRVRRMGIMVLYGSPALFCDVSDAWRLPPRRRAAVALAGVRVHAAVGAVLVLVAATMPPGDSRQLLAVAAVGNAVMALVNLYPFVKFDGYIALVGWLDRPHLRAHSMRAAQDVLLTRLTFGGQAPARSAQFADRRPMGGGWIFFGIASAVSAPVLVGVAFLSYGPLLLATLGPAGAVLTLGLLVLAVAQPTASVLRAARRAADSGTPRWRRVVGAAVLSCGVAALLSVPKVPLSATSVYQRIDGEILVAVPAGATIPLDATVTFQRPGVVLHPVTARGRVCGMLRHEQVSRSAGSPVTQPRGVPSRTALRTVVPICPLGDADFARLDGSGLASVSDGSVAIGTWLQRIFIRPAISELS